MDKVIDLLVEKNSYLEKFLHLNESEIANFAEGNFANLESFYNSREGLLKMIHKFDDLIEKATPEGVTANQIPSQVKKQVLKTLDAKNELVTSILSQDLQILSFIETAKSKIIKELSEVRTAKKAVVGYKVPTGSKRVDENY